MAQAKESLQTFGTITGKNSILTLIIPHQGLEVPSLTMRTRSRATAWSNTNVMDLVANAVSLAGLKRRRETSSLLKTL